MRVDADAIVIANTRLSDDYCVLAFEAPALGASLDAGQFVMIRTAEGDTPLLRRPFSVFERLRDRNGSIIGFSILNKRVGVGSARLFEAVAGQHVRCLGPLGRPFTRVAAPTQAWMVAGGTGLAPFATLSESLTGAGVAVTLFYGARTASELFCLDRFDRPGIRVVLASEDGTRGERGRVTVPFLRALADRPAGSQVFVYACGPGPMLQAVHELSAAHGCACEVATERQMGCGMGGCYSCVVRVRTADGGSRYVRSCLEGPVFASDVIVWDR